jgi:hypothetical protein
MGLKLSFYLEGRRIRALKDFEIRVLIVGGWRKLHKDEILAQPNFEDEISDGMKGETCGTNTKFC